MKTKRWIHLSAFMSFMSVSMVSVMSGAEEQFEQQSNLTPGDLVQVMVEASSKLTPAGGKNPHFAAIGSQKYDLQRLVVYQLAQKDVKLSSECKILHQTVPGVKYTSLSRCYLKMNSVKGPRIFELAVQETYGVAQGWPFSRTDRKLYLVGHVNIK